MVAVLVAVGVGAVVGVLSLASPEVGVAAGVAVGVATLLVQIFAWAGGDDDDSSSGMV